jgi:hypothetical protein
MRKKRQKCDKNPGILPINGGYWRLIVASTVAIYWLVSGLQGLNPAGNGLQAN